MINTITIRNRDEAIKSLAAAMIYGDKDDLGEALWKVENDTGYEIEYIYDIFVEQIEDELEEGADIECAIKAAAYYTLSPAYENDY